MTTLVDGVSFNAVSGGTGTFVFGSARNSFRTLAQAVADGSLSNGATVSYLAQDSLSNPKQREWGHGTFSQSGNSVARTTVLGGIDNGSDTGTSPVNFSHPPIVSLTALAEDLGSGNVFSELDISGPPTTSNIPASMFAVVKDTTQAAGFGNALYVNDNGSIINLTPKFFLNGNTTFYVSTTGSDSNSGLDALHPWKTLQHTVNVLATNVDANGFALTVQIADGTYAGFTINGAPQGIGSFYQFLGNVATPTNVVINDVSGGFSCIDIEAVIPAPMEFAGITFQPKVATNAGLTFDADFLLVFVAKCVFDGTVVSCGDAIGIFNNFCDLELGFDQSGSAGGGGVSNTITGTWRALINNFNDSFGGIVGPVTFSGTPNFTGATVKANSAGGVIQGNGETLTGTATGKRFNVSNGAAIVGDGSGNVNYYPGNASGTVGNNGSYDGIIYNQTAGLSPPAGQVPSYTATLPTTVSSSGSQFQYTFDGSGNLYFCYAPNTWAKYTNAAPFDNSGGGASEPIPVIFG